MASASNNEDVVELAKRHLDFPRRVQVCPIQTRFIGVYLTLSFVFLVWQDQAMLNAYVEELKFHLDLSPGDTNVPFFFSTRWSVVLSVSSCSFTSSRSRAWDVSALEDICGCMMEASSAQMGASFALSPLATTPSSTYTPKRAAGP